MPEKTDFDILIIGSGASGVQAATEAIKSDRKVGLLDIGITDQKYATRIPPKPFLDIRQTDPNQSYYFLGENIEQAFLSQNKAGAHLTPPRSHMIQDMEKFFPVILNNFFPLQSTALGGLGVSWGANVFVYEDFELKKIGINPQEIRPFYQEVAQDIGVSGNQKDDMGKL
ncbi:MAG: hypothetical protein HY843_03455, partial [Bdellovibrio sp.]|nr:hypothetical protein [Bdellovibrio sp.]